MAAATNKMQAPDTLARCPWPEQDPLYVAYHDEEWGVPEYDDRALYEKLMLDGFQAGLSWITILRKRENFRQAFDGFAPEKIARYRRTQDRAADAAMPASCATAPRSRARSPRRAPISKIMESGPGFSHLLWDFLDGRPKQNKFR